MSDIEKIVTKAVKGDSSAYTHLYKLARTQVYFTCLGILKNAADAEDIMQETFFTAAVKLPSLSDRNSFQAWVNRIAVNKCKNYLVKKKPDLYNDSNEETENELPDEEITLPDEYIDNKVKRKIIMDIIMDKLSDLQRQAVIMYYFDEMNLAEIAAEMNCPEGTVKSRLSSARKIIEKEILRYEKINQDRLHTVLPIPFLTQLLRAEAESISRISKLDFSFISASTANAAQVTASSGEAVHSATSRIIAGITAVVLGGSVAGGVAVHEINKREMQAQAGYEYYELLDEEYERTREEVYTFGNLELSNWNSNWDGSVVYMSNFFVNDLYRYNADENVLDLIIPEHSTEVININGKQTECQLYHMQYIYMNNCIYSTAYLNYWDKKDCVSSILIRYDTEGNMLNYIVCGDVTSYGNGLAIYAITDSEKIYFFHYKSDTDTTTIYNRVNLDFTGLEDNIHFGNLTQSCYISAAYNNTLYLYDEDNNYYAVTEDTLEIDEDNYLIKNNEEPLYGIGKYIMTPDAIYDMEKEKLLANVPIQRNHEYLWYFGGDYFFNGEKFIRLSSKKNYDDVNLNKLVEEEGVILDDSYGALGRVLLDDDTYLLITPESTFFCRFSTGEKTKIIFPWSDTGQE